MTLARSSYNPSQRPQDDASNAFDEALKTLQITLYLEIREKKTPETIMNFPLNP